MVLLPISITSDYSVLVKKDDVVKSGQVLAKRTTLSTDRISLTEAFKVTSHKVGKYLKVSPGDRIEKETVIAVKKSLFRETKVVSEIEGTVVSFEGDTGDLLIQPTSGAISEKIDSLTSPIDGIITVCNNEQIVIQTDKDVLLAKEGSGEHAEGELYGITSRDENPSSLLFALDTKIIGKIIALPAVDRDILLKAIGMGTEGVITTYADHSDIEYLSKRKIKTPVLIVDGETWKKLGKWAGKKVYIDGEGKTILLLHL